MNEFKFSALRQFGSENVSFTATVHSEKQSLSTAEIQGQIDQISLTIETAFKACQAREISEKALLVESSEKRTAEVAKLDKALNDEMEAKKKAQATMGNATKLDKALKLVQKEEKKGSK